MKETPPSASTIPQSETEYYLLEYLSHLYGSGIAPEHTRKLLETMQRAHIPNAKAQTSLNERDILLITYGDTLLDDRTMPLQVLKQFSDSYLRHLFSCIHILPFYPFSSDDGFAVVDYGRVREELGEWSDINALSEHFDLMFDLVINHCSREHLWFADFVNRRLPGCGFFIELPPQTDVSHVVRPRNTPLSSRIETYAGPKHVWTTFGDDQIDLNFENFEVLNRFVEILFDYVSRGADFIRLDAIAFLWKRLGTTCLNLPETHMVVKIMRLLLDHSGANVRLLTETNVPHMENISYFGQADEAHMIYQFSLAPLLVYSYLFNDARYLQQWALDLQAPPAGCTYLNFIASHDGIGLRPLENLMPERAVATLISTIHERGGFVSMRTGKGGEQRAYEMNVALFSAFGGTAASLPAYIGAHQLLLAFQGVPALYLRALLGTTNDLEEVERTGRTRSINRGHLQYDELIKDLEQPENLKAQVFMRIGHCLEIRRKQPAFSPEAHQQAVPSKPHLFVMKRQCSRQTIVVIASFSPLPQHLELAELFKPLPLDRFDGKPFPVLDLLTESVHDGNATFSMAPYQVVWLELPATT